jgi:diketogulonate reductase-like aldo/keto reductase
MTANRDAWTSSYGVTMPLILYGTAWKKEKTAGLVEQAINLGFRGIDTACQPKHYDEAGVGSGLSAALVNGLRRDDIFLQTKFTPFSGHDSERIPYDPRASLAQQVKQSFKQSQINLRTEWVDSLVLHSPLANPNDLREVWQSMETVFDEGGTKQLGISNCYDPALFKQLYENARIKPAVLQNRFYSKTGVDRELRVFCRLNKIFYQSFWTLTANPGLLAHDTVKALMGKYGRTAPQVFFRYLSQQHIIPLTGTTSGVHMGEDLDIASFELTEDECLSLERLLELPQHVS